MLAHMPRKPTARRSRVRRAVAITLVLLAGLLIAADRIGLAVAERAAAVTLQRSQHLTQRPSVSIAGFPFLTQLVSGKYDDIHVTADDVTVADGSTSLRIAQLDVTLHHVTVSRDFTSARSQYGTATALVHYADLAQLLGTQLSYAGAGRVRASAQVGVVPGLDVPASATAAVRVDGDALVFYDVRVSIAGQAVPAALTAYFAGLFGNSVSLRGLPFGVHVQSVGLAADGVRVALTASGLTYQR